jgi:hypothetical protein
MKRGSILAVSLALAALGAASAQAAAPKVPKSPVVLLGASVVQFWSDERPDFFAAHPDYLDQGRAGESPVVTVQRTAKDVLPLKPKLLFFISGGAATAERTQHDMALMADLGRRVGAKVVLAGSPAVREENLAAIRDYAQREGLGYADFADLRGPDGRVKPGMTYDGVHPTEAGYLLMEPVLVAAVDKALATP